MNKVQCPYCYYPVTIKLSEIDSMKACENCNTSLYLYVETEDEDFQEVTPIINEPI